METPQKSTVIQIVGASFCGSTLLETLLDSQSQICALGEAHTVYGMFEDMFSCRYCRIYDRLQCPFYNGFDKYKRNATEFYPYCFERSGASVLVDNSKSYLKFSLTRCNELSYRGVFISKTPHAAAYSTMKHHPGRDSLERYTDMYVNVYRNNKDVFSYWDVPIHIVQYPSLVEFPKSIVQSLCEACNVPFEDFILQKALCQPKSHIIGGNGSVASQATQRTFFTEGKYKGRYGSIFLDEEWKSDPTFIEEYLQVYRAKEKELEPVLAFLGQPDVTSLVHELEQVQTGSRVALV